MIRILLAEDDEAMRTYLVRAYSSVVEHRVDIAGVASSILATPTIEAKKAPCGAFFVRLVLSIEPGAPICPT